MTSMYSKIDVILNDLINKIHSLAVFQYAGNTTITPLTINIQAPFAFPSGGIVEVIDRTNEWSAVETFAPSSTRYTFNRVGASNVLFRVSVLMEFRNDGSGGSIDTEMSYQIGVNGIAVGNPFTTNTHANKPTIQSASGFVPMSDGYYIEALVTNIEDTTDGLVPTFSISFEEVL